jgi:hypothetical protein
METPKLMEASKLREQLNNMVNQANLRIEPKIMAAREAARERLDTKIENTICSLYEHAQTTTQNYNQLKPP